MSCPLRVALHARCTSILFIVVVESTTFDVFVDECRTTCVLVRIVVAVICCFSIGIVYYLRPCFFHCLFSVFAFPSRSGAPLLATSSHFSLMLAVFYTARPMVVMHTAKSQARVVSAGVFLLRRSTPGTQHC